MRTPSRQGRTPEETSAVGVGGLAVWGLVIIFGFLPVVASTLAWRNWRRATGLGIGFFSRSTHRF